MQLLNFILAYSDDIEYESNIIIIVSNPRQCKLPTGLTNKIRIQKRQANITRPSPADEYETIKVPIQPAQHAPAQHPQPSKSQS